ncbi:NAD(P)H-hydrate epimerase [Candidatus Lokiarchaeum ossiferum]|uniref:Bifunctional NAD(P)H-hydrate repair enzyme n=1 Tax=Candidatus Lokiarchaeum ossiferum TaxID=2951803 RepID=A0ABY6HX01_9ARCH|nr:NAD(P)H-hydrate epimerase [Candidatus Lokiarchaeum sp. B-35]
MVDFPNNPVKAEDISRLDENSVNLGIPKSFLMECAGLQATNKLMEMYNLNSSSKVIIFAGTGNNGGDGLVIARHLATRGINVIVALIGGASKIRTEESQRNWHILSSLVLTCQIEEIVDSSNIKLFVDKNSKADIIVDALLGTGVKGKIREPIASIIDVYNQYKCPKISIDIPTGIDPNTGKIFQKAVNWDFRIAFHRDKIGIYKFPNSWIAPIGIPVEAHVIIGEGDLQQCLKLRSRSNHKGEYGKLLIIGGSENFSGAPALAALIAIEFGIDLVNVLVPKNIANTVRQYSPNLIVREGINKNLCIDDFFMAKELSNWADAIVIGPGLGKSEETTSFFKKYVSWLLTSKKPCIIDADGIGLLGELIATEQVNLLNSNCLITPHKNELNSIISIEKIPANDSYFASCDFFYKNLAKIGGNYLIKGVNDYIIPQGCQNPKEIRINRTGCPEMAVGGTGDVLAGLCGSFAALGNSLAHSAGCAAFLNGLLGEYTKKILGSRIKASDLILHLRSFLKSKNL